MTAIEIARKLSALGQTEDACKAYTLAVQEDVEPLEQLEAAAYILQNRGDYRVSYTCFQSLYNQGFYKADILKLMSMVFYEPNIRLLKTRYERNCKRLKKYPYLFRTDFPAFEALPIRFFPYDDHDGYVPFYVREERFGEFVNVRETRISRNFFKDLEKPILAGDVYSQYELEYLNDNVRRSEDVAKENHIYLHYTDWETFCAWLQVLNMKPLVESRKVVFLIGDEISQYPIDFKERFGIDYSGREVKPIAISEVNRLIWHTQLSTHNGGDFFNEIFDAHPNLLCMPSLMLYSVKNAIAELRDALKQAQNLTQATKMITTVHPRLLVELLQMRNPTDKDLIVAYFLSNDMASGHMDPGARISPAFFFQPHFHNIVYTISADAAHNAVLESESYDEIHQLPLIDSFKYIKAFTPMRRFTTSHGATVKFMYNSAQEKPEEGEKDKTVVSDAVSERILNRSFMIDPEDRLYRDSVLVRLEDGKLNPKATFTALAAFLDLPYTQSMTCCTENGEPVPYLGGENYAPGFSPEPIYRTYDDYVNDSERRFIEYFLRDAYEYYGYDFQYYDGGPADVEVISGWMENFTTMDHYMRETWRKVFKEAEVSVEGKRIDAEAEAKVQEELLENYIQEFHRNRRRSVDILMNSLRFVNKHGQPLHMMPMLKLDPALLENPIYH